MEQVIVYLDFAGHDRGPPQPLLDAALAQLGLGFLLLGVGVHRGLLKGPLHHVLLDPASSKGRGGEACHLPSRATATGRGRR